MLVHPLMLAWIAGAALPLVVHLLSRSQYRAVDWGAMMFLTGQEVGTQSASLKQYFLLLLRMGMVGLLAIALARPIISSAFLRVPTAGLTTGGPAAAVIILDDSASMGYSVNNRSRLDAAREVTLQILSALKRGDQAALLLAGNRDAPSPALPSADLQSISATVADLQPGAGEADFANELNRAADLLAHTGTTHREIFLISDRQAVSYRNITETFKKSWSNRKNGASPPPVTVIPVGGDESDNISVDGIDFPDRPIIRDQNSEVQIRVHNYGSTPRSGINLSVWTGPRPIGETTIALPPRAVRVVKLPMKLTEAGSRVISAAVRSTGLTSDDRLDVTVDVLDPLQVLVVTSDYAGPTSRPSTDAAAVSIRLALTPFTISGHRGTDPVVLTMMVHRAWNAAFLKKFSVVILADVPNLSLEQANDLEQFVSAGGGVFLVPGDSVNIDDFNTVLFHGSGSVLPAKLIPPASPASPTFINASHLDRQNTVADALADQVESLSITPIDRYFRAVVDGSNFSAIARFNNGDPFLMESTIGRGRVMLMTTAIDPRWNGLAQSSVFLPMMQSIVRYLAIPQSVDRNVSPGQAMVEHVDGPVEDRSATVQFQPGGQREPATVVRIGDHSDIRYSRTNRIGSYRLRYRTAGKQTATSFAVVPLRRESDLTPLTDDQWRALADRVGFERVDLAQTSVASAISRQRGGREIWIDLVAGVLLLMTMEMLLSRYWA